MYDNMEKVDDLNMNDKVEPKGDALSGVDEVFDSGTMQSSTEAVDVTTKTWVVILVRHTITAIDTRVANSRVSRSLLYSSE
jgi:hypothetical protein